jgi:hypothetical protein
MEGSITQSLIGAIPHADISLDEIRALTHISKKVTVTSHI